MRINKTPRVTLAVISMAKARAYVAGRDYVIPDDIKYVYPATITHRLLITAEAKASGKTAGDITDEIISMTARRIIYIALLIGAALLHFAYGQYATHFILLFLLLAPVFSVLITLPAAIRARVTLTRGADVLRGRETGVGLSFDTFGLLPPEGWSAVVSSKNLFTGSEGPKHKVRLMGQKRYETEFPVDSSEIGSIRYTIRCPKCRA